MVKGAISIDIEGLEERSHKGLMRNWPHPAHRDSLSKFVERNVVAAIPIHHRKQLTCRDGTAMQGLS